MLSYKQLESKGGHGVSLRQLAPVKYVASWPAQNGLPERVSCLILDALVPKKLKATDAFRSVVFFVLAKLGDQRPGK